AQARGVRPAAVVDAVVNAILAREQARPDWSKWTAAQRARFIEQTRARVTSWVNSVATANRGAEGRDAPNGKAGPSDLDTAARAIGIGVDALTTALRQGQTVAQVAQARGVRPA